MSSVYNQNWQAFGGLPAFLYVWSALVVIMPTGFQTNIYWFNWSSSEWTSFSGNAITALTFANYILDPFYPECLPPPEAVRLIAACLICKPFLTFTFHLLQQAFKHQTKIWSSGFLTAVNCWNVKWATRVQDVATVTKVSRFLLWGIFWLKDFILSLSRSRPSWSLLLLVWSSLPSAPAPILR